MDHAYIYNLLVIAKYEFLDHLKTLEKLLYKISEDRINMKSEKSLFRCS